MSDAPQRGRDADMPERRTIGQILLSLGRITEEDVEQALAYQRDHGGYFGEALLACGILRKEELEWGLASQFDIPYVFPEADAVDPDAVALVTPEWALAHLTMPIMKTSDGLKVLVESPIETQAVDELHARTGLSIELALTSASAIRDLIRTVYSRAAPDEDVRDRAIDLESALGRALEAGSDRFGISTRGHRSRVWWEDDGQIHRRVLEGVWQSVLTEVLVPPPRDQVEGEVKVQWEGQLKRKGMVTPVEVRYMADESGHEYLFRPVRERSRLMEHFPLPEPGLAAEIRLLARSGAARFVVTTQPPELGRELLPHLPTLLLDPAWRGIYVSTAEQPAAEATFSMRLPRDPTYWARELETLRAFRFDVVTVDLNGNEEAWASSALDVAAVAFLRWSHDQERRPAYEAGIRWELHVARLPDGDLKWSIEPLRL